MENETAPIVETVAGQPIAPFVLPPPAPDVVAQLSELKELIAKEATAYTQYRLLMEAAKKPKDEAEHTRMVKQDNVQKYIVQSLAEDMGVRRGDVLLASRRLSYGGRRANQTKIDFFYLVERVQFSGDVDTLAQAGKYSPDDITVTVQELDDHGRRYSTQSATTRTLSMFIGRVTDTHPFMRKYCKQEVKRQLIGQGDWKGQV